MQGVLPLHKRTADDQIAHLRRCDQYDIADALSEFMRSSRVRDILYHGTTHDFDSFEPDAHGYKDGYWGGKGVYLTTSPVDASENYAGRGPDLESKIERRAEELVYEWEDKGAPAEIEEEFEVVNTLGRLDLAKEYAAKELDGGQASIIPVFVCSENPVIIERGGGTILELEFPTLNKYEEEIEQIESEISDIEYRLSHEELDDELVEELENQIEDLEDEKERLEELRDQYEYNEVPEGNGGRVLEAAQEVASLYEVNPEEVRSQLFELLLESATAFEIDQCLQKLFEYAENDRGELARGEALAEIWKRAGYDSIVHDAYETFVHMKGVKPGDRHVFVFDPHRIKSAIGCRTYNMRSRSITDADLREEPVYSPSEDLARRIRGTFDAVESLAHDMLEAGNQPAKSMMR